MNLPSNPADQPRSILVVDDDEVFRNRLVESLRNRGCLANPARSFSEAIAKLETQSHEAAVIDLRLLESTGVESSGLELIEAIRKLAPDMKLVMLTGYGSIATAVDAVRLGACNYLTKPANADEILAAFSGGTNTDKISTPSLAKAEWEHIQRVLSDCGGNVTHAAKFLGIPRRTLQRKLAQLPPRK